MRTRTLRPILGRVFWGVAAVVIGYYSYSWWNAPPTPNTAANAPAQNQREVYPDPLTLQANALCNGEKKQMEYKKLPTRVNPNGHCAPGFWHERHCIYVWQAGKTDEFQKIKVCHKPNEPDEKRRYDPMPVDVEFVATADTVFTDYYWLLPRKAVQFFR
ncbi:MAG: hypothetical protein WCK46_02595 [Candidatus Adlerbacteria bacterium]